MKARLLYTGGLVALALLGLFQLPGASGRAGPGGGVINQDVMDALEERAEVLVIINLVPPTKVTQ